MSVLVDVGVNVFDALDDPLAAIRLHQMHEVGADGAAVDLARFGGDRAADLQVGIFQRLEDAEWIEIGFEISPAAKCVENALAL